VVLTLTKVGHNLSIENWKPTSCVVCGHYSHCGQPLWLENKNPQDGNNIYKACENCSCEKCNKGDSND